MAKLRLDRPLVLALMVAILGTLVFVPAITGGWIFDDHPLIEDNPYIHSLRWFPRWFTHDFWNVNEEVLRFGTRMVYWRPFATATYAVDWNIGGGSPVVFHISNLIFQAIVGALAFVVLRRWIGSNVPAFAAALLFAVHPTKAESVAWIAGRTDILCMIAVLLASEGIARRLRSQRGGIPLEIAGTVAAYLCKEQAIVLPAFAAVETWVALGRPPLDRAVVRPVLRAVLPQTAVALGYLAIRAAVLPIQSAGGSSRLPLFEHLQIVLESIGRFVTLTFAPHDLSIQQGLLHFRNRLPVHDPTYVLVGAIALAGFAAIAWFSRRRWPFVTVGIGFYLATLLPTSNVKYTQMVTLISERFLYLPSFGIALIVGCLVANDRIRKRVTYTAVAAAILATGLISMSRSADYRDEQHFWERELAVNPDSGMARQYKIAAQVRERQYRPALVEILELDRREPFDGTRDQELTVAVQVADVVSRLIPDHRTEDLRTIDRFIADLIDKRSGVAQLDVLHVHFSYPLRTLLYLERLITPRLLVQRAALLGRLAEDAKALELARSAVAQCRECVSVITTAAMVYARAGNYDEAIALLDKAKRMVNERPIKAMEAQIRKAWIAHQEALKTTGPIQLQRRATELASLELWGRAYDVLAPYQEQIKTAPGVAEGFAELAFRAGETAIARDVLAVTMPPDAIDARLNEWALTMGWAEQAR